MTQSLERLQPGIFVLPIFRRTHARLLSFSSRRDQVTARDVAMEILTDPLATFYTLHTINKRVSERSSAEVDTVEHALMMQGIGSYVDAVRRIPVIENLPVGQNPRVMAGLQCLVRRAQHAAWQARDFAVLHSDIRAEEVQVAALLYYIPELLLWLRMPKHALRLRRERRRHWGSGQHSHAGQHLDAEAERVVLGDTLDNVRLTLLESWNIPPLTLDLLSQKNAERARQIMLKACLDIAQRSDRGWWDEGLMDDYTALANIENTPIESIMATVHSNAARVARHCSWLQAPPAAAWGPMIPGPWPPEEDDDEDEQPEPARAAAKAAPAAPPDRTKPKIAEVVTLKVAPTADKTILREALNGITAHLDNTYTLNQMSAVILKGLHSGLGLSRVVLGMLMPDGLRVKARFTLGVDAEDTLRLFEFELAEKDLFSQVMGKMQGIWMNDGNREKLWPMINPKLQTMLSSGDFFTMSLYNGSKPIGIIYADRGKDAENSENKLDPMIYTDFKMLCLQAARGLSKIKSPV